MDISNRTLATFLLLAIVVSLGGTLVSLNKLNSLTGFATTGTGNVSLSVGSTLSITTIDSNAINFGSCSPLSGVEGIINSENASTTNTSQICPSFTQNNITVRNDGNTPANVTIRPNKIGGAQGGLFLNSTTLKSALAYKTIKSGRGSYTNGCVGNIQTNYTNFTSTTTNLTACSNLTSGATNNTFLTHVQIIVPYDAPGGQSDVILTYVAWNA
jgi:hypothetical protein